MSVWLSLFPNRINFVFHSLAASPYLYYLLRTLLQVGFVMHLVGQCSLTPDSRWKIRDLLSCKCEAPKLPSSHWCCRLQSHGSLAVLEKGLIGLRSCDAAAKSFICRAGRLSINEVVKGGDVCGRGERRKGFYKKPWVASVCVGWVPFFYLPNSRGDQYTKELKK